MTHNLSPKIYLHEALILSLGFDSEQQDASAGKYSVDTEYQSDHKYNMA
jgi:hypothetical protein